MPLDRLQKIALARLLSDLIEADFVVEGAEMAYFERLISREGMNVRESMLVEAKKMDFGKAVGILKELPMEQRREVVGLLKGMSLADEECVPAEAVQILAIEQALLWDAHIYSVPKNNVNFERQTVLYVENEDNTAIGASIDRDYEAISGKLAEAGFEFVHIPHIVGDFRLMSRGYLGKVVKYMIPSVPEGKAEMICRDLCELTTSQFCRNLLYKKTGMNLQGASPSLLIKIGESIIVDQFSSDEAERTDYSNFLRIELQDNILEQIEELLVRYRSMVSETMLVPKNRPRNGKFIYYGFHRSLFDLIAYGREQKDYRLVFNISKPQAAVYFEPLNGDGEKIPLKLTPQETALFMLIVRRSLDGEGLDWREQIPQQEKQEILEEYNRIYSFIGKGNTTSEYKDRTHTNHIKNRIRVLQGIANMDMFIPEHIKSGEKSLYRVKAARQYIRILENTTL